MVPQVHAPSRLGFAHASPVDSRGLLDGAVRPVAGKPGRSVVASAPALGAGDRRFESCRPDHHVVPSGGAVGVHPRHRNDESPDSRTQYRRLPTDCDV